MLTIQSPIVRAVKRGPGITQVIGWRRDAALGRFAEPMQNQRLFKVHVRRDGIVSTTTIRAESITEAESRARYIFNRADSLTVEIAEPSELERIRVEQFREAARNTEILERRNDPLRAVRGIWIALRLSAGLWLVLGAIAAAFLLAGCHSSASGSGSQPLPAPDGDLTFAYEWQTEAPDCIRVRATLDAPRFGDWSPCLDIRGPAGTDGASIYATWINDCVLGIQSAVYEEHNLCGRDGVDGAPGATGPMGPQGSIGLTGATGPMGLPGADGVSPVVAWVSQCELSINGVVHYVCGDGTPPPGPTYCESNPTDVECIPATWGGSYIAIWRAPDFYAFNAQSFYYCTWQPDVLAAACVSTGGQQDIDVIYNADGSITFNGSVLPRNTPQSVQAYNMNQTFLGSSLSGQIVGAMQSTGVFSGNVAGCIVSGALTEPDHNIYKASVASLCIDNGNPLTGYAVVLGNGQARIAVHTGGETVRIL